MTLARHYHEDREVLHVNTLPQHNYFIPYHTEEAAARGERTQSERLVLFSGLWHFDYYESELDLPEGFPAVQMSGETIPVPSVWQMHGYDHHQYLNVGYPIPLDPPHVPLETPCGHYRRSFTLSAEDLNDSLTLCFEGVDSCHYVWLNGAFLGYSQVSHSTSEFDLGPLAREGENTLDVLVFKWCDGTYLEDQDKLRMSGIFRDVYLLKRPQDRLFAYEIKAVPDLAQDAARISAVFRFSGETLPVKYKLHAPDGTLCAEGNAENTLTLDIAHPALWNAESPELYTLMMAVGGEYICEKIGIREIAIRNGVLQINGQHVKFRGVNRHESHPHKGYAVDVQDMLQDLRMMKEHNINAIRTSHYPDSPLFYELCDRYGFYLVDEADMECHGVTMTTGRYDQEHSYDLYAQDPQWLNSMMDRLQCLVERDINRPCVVIWSMGNESGMGSNIEQMLAWTKQRDASRLTHYERAAFPPDQGEIVGSDLDLYSRMYTSVEEIDEYFDTHFLNKPYVLCEYAHAMGNGPGGLEQYEQCFQRHEGSCGGFVWEWCDHSAIREPSEDGVPHFGYGGDFGDTINDGNFCLDALVSPLREPHPGLIEFRNVNRPVRFFDVNAANGLFRVHNYLDFTTADKHVCVSWELRREGKTVASGTVPQNQLHIPPHGDGLISIDFDGQMTENTAVYFEIRSVNAYGLVGKGTYLGCEQLGVQHYPKAQKQPTCDAVHCQSRGRFIQVTGPDFTYSFNRVTCAFDRLVYGGHDLIVRPMNIDIWHAPIDNERFLKHEWYNRGYDKAGVQLRRLEMMEAEGYADILCEFVMSAVYLPNILSGKVIWHITADGQIGASFDIIKDDQTPPLPRFGVRLFVPADMQNTEYFGKGPWQAYSDMQSASVTHLYRATVDELHVPFIRPQESGSHCGCEYLRLSGDTAAWQVRGESFSFNVSHYTHEELESKRHADELQKADCTILSIDYAHNGIGSNSCGPQPEKNCRLNGRFFFGFTMEPSLL